jgi:hypothetical protein
MGMCYINRYMPDEAYVGLRPTINNAGQSPAFLHLHIIQPARDFYYLKSGYGFWNS